MEENFFNEKEVLHMVGQMENLVENTIAQAEHIADETETQEWEIYSVAGHNRIH